MAAYDSHENGSQFVVTVLQNGKPIREFNEDSRRTCRLAFGSEYALKIKNKNGLRALAKIEIDGTEVLTGGKALVLEPYAEVTVERFIDSLTEGKKFKFVSVEEGTRTGQIQDPSSPQNGLVRVYLYPEKKPDLRLSEGVKISSDTSKSRHRYSGGGQSASLNTKGILRGQSTDSGYTTDSHIWQSSDDTPQPMSASFCSAPRDYQERALGFMDLGRESVSDKGGTAEGSNSSQTFRWSGDRFPTETVPVILDIWLKGPQSGSGSVYPFTVRIKNGNIWVENAQGKKVWTDYIMLDNGFAIVKTKDFSFANSFMKDCVTLTNDGFEIRAAGYQLVAE